MFSFNNFVRTGAKNSEEFIDRIWTVWDKLPGFVKDDITYLIMQVDSKSSGLCQNFAALMRKSDEHFVSTLCAYISAKNKNEEATYVNNCVSLSEKVYNKDKTESEGQPLEERIEDVDSAEKYATFVQDASFGADFKELTDLRDFILTTERVDIYFLIARAAEKKDSALKRKSAEILKVLVVKYNFKDLLLDIMRLDYAVDCIEALSSCKPHYMG